MQNPFTKSTFLTALGIVCISISSYLPLQLPLIPTDIPGTWQTFAVLVFSYFCSRWVAIAASSGYILIGILGAPVFADGSSGIDVLIGRTGGYLYGFIIAAWLSAYFAKCEAVFFTKENVKGQTISRRTFNHWAKYFAYCLLAMFAGTCVILACGITHLSQSIGLANALQYGLYPFLLGAMIKIVAGAFIVTLLKYIGAQRTIYSVTTKST